MSREYAENRIRDALKLHRGNATRARQQVMAWAVDDQRLLLALASPHLTGIVAHAVNRVISKTDREGDEEQDAPRSLDLPPDTFGREMLRALSSRDTTVFGRDNGIPGGRTPASQSHIDAMRRLAGKPGRRSDT